MSHTTIARPDGRMYRSRKPGLWARGWQNHDFLNEGEGVIVFGTLDPDEASPLARRSATYWYGDTDLYDLADPTPGWWRDGYVGSERTWIRDDRRGAPGVMFTWAERTTQIPAEVCAGDR